MTCYEIWSLIIGAVGAIATFSAVIVALWQTKFANMKKLKLSFSSGIATLISDKDYIFVGLSIANIGNRDITIKNWGFNLDNGEKLLVVQLHDFPIKQMQPELPHKLHQEEQIMLYFPKDKFISLVKSNVDSGKLKKTKKIKVWAVDSTGKEYNTLSPEKAIDYYNWH